MDKLKKNLVCPISLIFGAQSAFDEKPSMLKFETDGTFLL